MTVSDVIGERRRELGRFLRNRRARLQPADVGLPHGPGYRRVAGLRREEVAALAGVGVSWYTMLENGTADGTSPQTLAAIARALALSADEIHYLHELASGEITSPPHAVIDELALGTLAAIAWAPAYICTTQWMVLAWNPAMTLVWNLDAPGGAPFNIVRRTFLDPAMRALHGDTFAQFAGRLVAMVRSGAGRRADDPVYAALVTELRKDAVFAAAWEAYDIARPLSSARTTITSPAIGTFTYEPLTLPIPGDAAHAIVVQIPDDTSARRLRATLTSMAPAIG